MNIQEKTILEPVAIGTLLDKQFFIPDYQRGYRWRAEEVKILLKDIDGFVPKELGSENGKTWYCLQPLVVKPCSLERKLQFNLQDEWFEVIDGQQRLTTIYLIGHYINEMWRGKQKDDEIAIRYQTREKSSEFLKALNVDDEGNVKLDKSNIDFYHISMAYDAIHKWVVENKALKRDSFIDKFFNYTKVIWYETDEADSNAVFRRLNTGKIPLTNAELVKALFLNSTNFKGSNDVSARQFEIANEWDQIEYSLQNDDFWYFINKEENTSPTRIEFILNLHSEKRQDDLNLPPWKPMSDKQDYFTFNYFSGMFSQYNVEEINQNWNRIKRTFQILNEWYNDSLLHNKIGFLIYCGININNLLEDYVKVGKTQFKENLDALISIEMESIDIDKLEYSSNNLIKLRKLFLLYNIQTMLINESDQSKFQFRKFKDKKRGWDIEHIHSIAEKEPATDEHMANWVTETLPFIKDVQLISEMNNYKNTVFSQLYGKVYNYFAKVETGEGMPESNELSNLALLDAETNRSYKNAVFPKKRSIILEKDKAGHFIPQCTKNLFMKYYSTDASHLSFWTTADREDYFNDLEKTLKPYLKTRTQTQTENGNG